MSDKMPMYDVEKVKSSILIKATTLLKLRKLCDATGIKMSGLCGGILEDATKKVALTEEEVEEAHEIVRKNIAKRKAKKAKKGIK